MILSTGGGEAGRGVSGAGESGNGVKGESGGRSGNKSGGRGTYRAGGWSDFGVEVVNGEADGVWKSARPKNEERSAGVGSLIGKGNVPGSSRASSSVELAERSEGEGSVGSG